MEEGMTDGMRKARELGRCSARATSTRRGACAAALRGRRGGRRDGAAGELEREIARALQRARSRPERRAGVRAALRSCRVARSTRAGRGAEQLRQAAGAGERGDLQGAWRPARSPASSCRPEARRCQSRVAANTRLRIIEPLIGVLARHRVHPNLLTTLGFIATLGAGFAFHQHAVRWPGCSSCWAASSTSSTAASRG
jgi:hypothetical protein